MSQTGADIEGHGETKRRFYQVLALLEGQGGTESDMGLPCGHAIVRSGSEPARILYMSSQ